MPLPTARYRTEKILCPCGSECLVETAGGWIWVTCKNQKCPEHNIRQLPAFRKHNFVMSEAVG